MLFLCMCDAGMPGVKGAALPRDARAPLPAAGGQEGSLRLPGSELSAVFCAGLGLWRGSWLVSHV